MKEIIPHFVPYWSRDEIEAVSDVLENSDYLNEHETVRSFEGSFAKYVGAKYCVAVTSGTTALYCAINALNLQKEEAVCIPTHDGIFAFNALIAAGGSPEVCDVDSHGLLDVSSARTQADGHTAIMVHANGRISGTASLLEDCAQAIFHHTRDSVSTYSFASTKHITTGGQGGAICCDDSDIFDALTRLKDHGRNDRQLLRPMSDSYDRWGMNFKMTEIQAAFGLAQLRGLDGRMRRFREICSIYRDLLGMRYRLTRSSPAGTPTCSLPEGRISARSSKKMESTADRTQNRCTCRRSHPADLAPQTFQWRRRDIDPACTCHLLRTCRMKT